MYNRDMFRRVLLCLLAALLVAACTRSREIERELQIEDVHTGWYDVGIVGEGMNKLVPSISLRLRNVSDRAISSVQVMAIFRRVTEPDESWGDHFVMAIGREGLEGSATADPLVLRSSLGYTGEEPRLQMLQHSEFIDAQVEIFGKHGPRAWVKLAEFPIERQLLTE